MAGKNQQTPSLDEKDTEILLALIRDARAPLTAVAQQAGLSVAATSNRIDKLEESGVIKSYKLVLNHRVFPVQEFDVYYTLTGLSEQTVDDAVQALSRSGYTTQVLTTMGCCDVRTTVLAKDIAHLQEVLEEAERPFCANIQRRDILAVTTKYKSTAKSFLRSLFGAAAGDAEQSLAQVYPQAHASLDDTDRDLLRALAADVRASYKDLGSAAGVSPESASSRIKKLEEQQVILGYQALLDGPLLGHRWAVLLVNLRHESPQARADVLAHVQAHDNVTSAVELVGRYNVSVTLFGESLDAIRETELSFREGFGEQVTESDLLFILENHKYPEIASNILNLV